MADFDINHSTLNFTVNYIELTFNKLEYSAI